MPFQIVRNDITKVKADAIVNTANPKPIYGDGTDRAIYEAAGKKKLLVERKKIGDIARGQAAVTPAFNLNAKYIIHTVGPMWQGGGNGEFEVLKACYENSLNLALDLKCRSIAFPLIATGVYGFPKDKALQIAMSVIEPFLMEHAMKVIMVVFDHSSFELSGRIVEKVEAYVDENYVKAQRKRQYLTESEGVFSAEAAERRMRERMRREREELCMLSEIDVSRDDRKKKEESSGTVQPKKVRIDDLLASSEKTFQQKFLELMDEKGLTPPEVYKTADLSKQVFSKMLCDEEYHPNKYTAIKLCLTLKLDIDQTVDLLSRAGWTLSPSSKPDLVVKGCIINQEYKEVNIDLIMFDKCQTTLSKIK